MRVRVYRNLNRNCWSVQTKTPKGWRLWKHADNLYITNAITKVSEAGRQRVLREQRKNVHAYIEGDFLDTLYFPAEGHEWNRVEYDPYRSETFVYADSGAEIVGADVVEFTNKGSVIVGSPRKKTEISVDFQEQIGYNLGRSVEGISLRPAQ